MTKAAKQILSEAMSLSESERVELAARLLDPFDATVDDDYAKAWEAEIESRLADVDRGKVKPVPWDKARAMIQRRDKRNARAG